jgi:hypothetical protein
VDKYPPIVARAVLIDVAKSKGVERLPDSYSITVADLQDALKKPPATAVEADMVIRRPNKIAKHGEITVGRFTLSAAHAFGTLIHYSDAAQWRGRESQEHPCQPEKIRERTSFRLGRRRLGR